MKRVKKSKSKEMVQQKMEFRASKLCMSLTELSMLWEYIINRPGVAGAVLQTPMRGSSHLASSHSLLTR